jgi:prophage maintenance system killer protein
LLTTHSLLNGNKRFATSVMILMLYNFGYFFWMEKYYSQEVEEKILNFLMTWENRKMLNKEITIDKIISEIKDWISCNATIALNFRNKI